MKYHVKFETDSDGEDIVVGANDLTLLDTVPQIISQDADVTVARYDFPDHITEDQIADALDDTQQCAWCNTGWGQVEDDRPEM